MTGKSNKNILRFLSVQESNNKVSSLMEIRSTFTKSIIKPDGEERMMGIQANKEG